jgi:3-oxoacyl-[acyl-carrier protein] reductase
MTTNIKKVALVTGASSGIGRAIALRLSRKNFFTLVHYHRNQSGAEETVRQIIAEGGNGDLISFNVQDRTASDTKVSEWFLAHPDTVWECLVNNAGLHIDNLAGMLSDEAFDEVLKTNTYGAFYLMRAAVRKMLRNRSGCIVNISSLSGQTGNPGQINYAASKAALIAMTKSLAMEVGSRGIRVNAVAPGIIETEMSAGNTHLEKLRERIPLQRFGTADEVAAVVGFLVSEDASYITGHTISVNGGLFPS